MRTLLNWMVKRARITVNPLNCVEILPMDGGRVRPRRAFSDDEMRRLLTVADETRVVYLVAAFTGLRRSELAGIRLGDLVLEGDVVRVIARASTTKNHKEARIRLHPMAVAALREYLSGKGFSGADRVLADLLPKMDEFRIHLEKAGIPFIDGSGFRADFHSLRHTFCTRLQNADVSERCAMELMRHGDRKLTNKVYTDSRLLPLDDAILKLPGFEQPVTQIHTQDFVPLGPSLSQGGKQAEAVNGSRDGYECWI